MRRRQIYIHSKVNKISLLTIIIFFTLFTLLTNTYADEVEIKKIQQFLTDKGCEPNGVDGGWGGGSKKAAQRYLDVSGITLGPDSPLENINEIFLKPACGDDITLAPSGKLSTYSTPTDTLTLPGGFEQYNWIPQHLRDFKWPTTSTAFFDLNARMSVFGKNERRMLGCRNFVRKNASSDLINQLTANDLSKALNEGSIISFSLNAIPQAICQQSWQPIRNIIDLFAEWADHNEFLDFNLLNQTLEHRKTETKFPKADYTKALHVSHTLVFREQLTEMLMIWSLAKTGGISMADEKITKIETWLKKMVELQAFPYAQTPLDCPSFDKMNGRQLEYPYMRIDQFEECINTGTSRIGVSAMWALVSGDRDYATDALNTYFMTINQLRKDGSHMLESVRFEIAHYKAVYTMTWMTVVSEAFERVGIDIYNEQINGKSMDMHAEFLAKSAIDRKLIKKYSGVANQESREYKDASQWVILAKHPKTKAVKLLTRQLATTQDRINLDYKMFRFSTGFYRPDKGYFLSRLLPFTAIYAPANIGEYLPPDLLPRLTHDPDKCPDMKWTKKDEKYAGKHTFEWSILNIFDNSLEQQGQDLVELKNGKGSIKIFNAQQPAEALRKDLQIVYGDGKICVAGKINLFEPEPIHLVRLQGDFKSKTIKGKWPDGDEITIKLLPAKKFVSDPNACPLMDWSEKDEKYAGKYKFKWTILNSFDNKLEPQGSDFVELKDGKGIITSFFAENPIKKLRQDLDIAYGNGNICISGMMNLFDPEPVHLIKMKGDFKSNKIIGRWFEGDKFIVELETR
ncbi:MAG: alginate lyase family protein [Alphaproteobacteria bacterium]|nr:alginate lyase family protein [Alphaproteobacteria bacterium]